MFLSISIYVKRLLSILFLLSYFVVIGAEPVIVPQPGSLSVTVNSNGVLLRPPNFLSTNGIMRTNNVIAGTNIVIEQVNRTNITINVDSSLTNGLLATNNIIAGTNLVIERSGNNLTLSVNTNNLGGGGSSDTNTPWLAASNYTWNATNALPPFSYVNSITNGLLSQNTTNDLWQSGTNASWLAASNYTWNATNVLPSSNYVISLTNGLLATNNLIAGTNLVIERSGNNLTLSVNTNNLGGGGGSTITDYVKNISGNTTNMTNWDISYLTDSSSGNWHVISYITNGIHTKSIYDSSVGSYVPLYNIDSTNGFVYNYTSNYFAANTGIAGRLDIGGMVIESSGNGTIYQNSIPMFEFNINNSGLEYVRIASPYFAVPSSLTAGVIYSDGSFFRSSEILNDTLTNALVGISGNIQTNLTYLETNKVSRADTNQFLVAGQALTAGTNFPSNTYLNSVQINPGWINAGLTYTGLRVLVTDTSSGANSTLASFGTTGTPDMFPFYKDGVRIGTKGSVYIGLDAGKGRTSTDANNVMIGNSAGGTAANKGAGNTIVGNSGFASYLSGASYNAIFGANAGQGASANMGDRNTIIGAYAAYGGVGSYNVVIGQGAFQNSGGLNIHSNIIIGATGGSQLANTTANILLIDNGSRSSSANTITQAIIYGNMAVDRTNQNLTINANLRTSMALFVTNSVENITNQLGGNTAHTSGSMGEFIWLGKWNGRGIINTNEDYNPSTSYIQITNYLNMVSRGFNCNTTNGSATNLVAGYYAIDVTASFVGAADSPTYEVGVFTNGVECNIEFQRNTSSTAVGSAAASGIMYLPAGVATDLRVKSDAGGGASCIFKELSLRLKQL